MGTVTKQGSISAHPTSYDTVHYSYASVSSSYPISNAYTDSSSTSYAQVSWTTGSGAETYVYLKFDFSSIPAGATIKTVTAKAKGYVNTTNSSRVTSRQMQLATGTTLKGSALTISNSTTEQTFSSVGTWTRAEILDAGVRFYVKRGTSNTSSAYNLRMYGATMTVTYEYQETTYTVTVSNSTSTTVTANPSEVVQGEDSLIRADSVSGLTITDNGADVTSQFVEIQEQGASYTVESITSTYGFALNGSGYYESNNKTHSKTCCVARVNIHLPVAGTVTFTYINYAEEAYDFGVFGNVDVALNTDYYAAGSGGATITDSNYKLACNSSTHNKSTAQTLTYSDISSGDHFIDVKYSKDDASDANSDTLQFKLAITLDEPFTPGTYYEYTVTNVQADHTIAVTYSGGGGNPPVITVGTPNRNIISSVSGYDQCVCTFTSDLALQQWEARATKAGTTPARGVGLLVESGGSLAANTAATVYVENEELTNGDGLYTITVYGQSVGGVWSE